MLTSWQSRGLKTTAILGHILTTRLRLAQHLVLAQRLSLGRGDDAAAGGTGLALGSKEAHRELAGLAVSPGPDTPLSVPLGPPTTP